MFEKILTKCLFTYYILKHGSAICYNPYNFTLDPFKKTFIFGTKKLIIRMCTTKGIKQHNDPVLYVITKSLE